MKYIFIVLLILFGACKSELEVTQVPSQLPNFGIITNDTINENQQNQKVLFNNPKEDELNELEISCVYDQVIDDLVNSTSNCAVLGASISANGEFNWSPSFSHSGDYEFKVTIEKPSRNASNSKIFSISVVNVNRAPVLDAISNESVMENSPVSQVNVGDGSDDFDIDNDALTYNCIFETTINASFDGPGTDCIALPGVVSFDSSTGVFDWTPDFTAAGTYELWISGSDGSLSDDELVVITVNNVNRAPVLDAIGDESVNENVAITQIDAADSGDDNDTDSEVLLYSCTYDIIIDGAVAAGSICSQANLGGTFSFNTGSGLFDWTPGFSAFENGEGSGRYEFKIVADDQQALGNSTDEEIFVITVNHVNQAPVIDTIADDSVNENSVLTQINVADGGDDSDADSEALLYSCTYDIVIDGAVAAGSTCSQANLGGTFSFNTGSGLFNWTPGYNAFENGDGSGRYEFKIVADDQQALGNSTDDEVFIITVNHVNQAPVIDAIADDSVNENAVLTQINVADGGDDNDGDSEALLYSCTYDIVIDGAVAAGTTCSQANLGGTFSFNTGSGLFNWTPGFSAFENGDGSGRYEFKIIADDQQALGNSTDDEVFIITVNHVNQAPVIDAIADDSVNENAVLTQINVADGGDDNDADSEVLLYSCTYDIVIDGAVAAGTTCSQANLGGTFSFNTGSGIFNWTPSYNAFENGDGSGRYEFKIVANDQQALGNSTDDEIFVITVNHVNQAPVIDAIADDSVNENAALTQINVADGGDDNDADSEALLYSCTYDIVIDGVVAAGTTCSQANLGGTFSFNSGSGLFDWTPDLNGYDNGDASGRYEFKIVADDQQALGNSMDDEIFVITVNDSSPFAGGDGTCVTNPYQIATAAQLDYIKDYSSDCFILNNDIDMTGHTTYAPAATFTGNFNGNDKKISNWTETGGTIKSFFGDLGAGATIHNLSMVGINLNAGAQDYVGAIFNRSFNQSTSSVYNIEVSGSVTSTGNIIGGIGGSIFNADNDKYYQLHFKGSVNGANQVGGILGQADTLANAGSSLSKVSVYGTVTASTNNVGGIVGEASNQFYLEEAYNFASVTAVGTSAGGIVGTNQLGNNTYKYVINRGDVRSNQTGVDGVAGGIIGDSITGSPNITLIDVINTGKVSALTGTSTIGSIVGHAVGSVTTANAFFDLTTTELSASTGSASSASVNANAWYNPRMKKNTEFSGLNATYWDTSVNGEYPRLKFRTGGTCDGGSPFDDGVGTMYDPYLICTLTQLEQLSTNLYNESAFILAANIDMTGTSYTPLSGNFSGTLLGNYNKLSNWTYDSSGADNTGFFDNLDNALVEDVKIENFDITGNTNTGSLAGQVINKSIISNIKVSNSNINVESTTAGGIAGAIGNNSKAYDLSFITGTINDTNPSQTYVYTGGIFGYVGSGAYVVRAQTVGGVITADAVVGGSFGQIYNSTSEAHQLKSTMTVKSVSPATVGNRAAGLIGTLQQAQVYDAYFEGTVGFKEWYAGLLGAHATPGTTTRLIRAWTVADLSSGGTNCDGLVFGRDYGESGVFSEVYADTQASSTTDLDGCGSDTGYSGANTATMQSRAQYASWSSNIWFITDNDYPRFTWEISDYEPNIGEVADSEISYGQDWALNINDTYTNSDVDIDGEAITYQCKYDVIQDNSVVSPTDCTTLPGFTLNAATGELAWSPTSGEAGNYEFKIIATSGSKTDEDIFSIDVIIMTGSGTAPTPYIITNTDALNQIATYPTAYFRLGNDIDMTAFSYTPPASFSGDFDGNNFSISNYTDTSGDSGFFGNISGDIHDLVMSNVNVSWSGSGDDSSTLGVLTGGTLTNIEISGIVTSDNCTGGIVISVQSSSTISNVHFKGQITSTYNMGGIACYASGDDILIEKVSVYGSIGSNANITANIGGILGSATDTIDNGNSVTIDQAYNFSKISAKQGHTGGIIGDCNGCVISHSINRGDVIDTNGGGAFGLGGIVGSVNKQGTTEATLNEVINTGRIAGAATTHMGAIFGYVTDTPTVTDAIYDISTSELSTGHGSSSPTVPFTTSYYMPAMKTNTNFSSFDITDWDTSKNGEYPQLKWRAGDPAGCNPIGVPFGGGVGTMYDPYQICDLAHIESLNAADYSSNSFILLNDIDMTGSTYVPMANTFKGIILGNYHELSNWTYLSITSDYVGFFTSATDAIIEDLAIDNFDVLGDQVVGSLAGQILGDSLVANIDISNSSIVGNQDLIGGLSGAINHNTLIIDATAWANAVKSNGVSGYTQLGGIVGQVNDNTELRRVKNSAGTIEGRSILGGITGSVYGASIIAQAAASDLTFIRQGNNNRTGGVIGALATGTINDVYFDGAIDAYEWYGGLIGAHGYGAGAPSVNRAWVVADFTGGGTNCDGLVFGKDEGDSGVFSEVYADTQASSTTDLDGCGADTGYSGQTTATMQDDSLYSTWPTEIWNIPPNAGSDYPRFTWE